MARCNDAGVPHHLQKNNPFHGEILEDQLSRCELSLPPYARSGISKTCFQQLRE